MQTQLVGTMAASQNLMETLRGKTAGSCEPNLLNDGLREEVARWQVRSAAIAATHSARRIILPAAPTQAAPTSELL